MERKFVYDIRSKCFPQVVPRLPATADTQERASKISKFMLHPLHFDILAVFLQVRKKTRAAFRLILGKVSFSRQKRFLTAF